MQKVTSTTRCLGAVTSINFVTLRKFALATLSPVLTCLLMSVQSPGAVTVINTLADLQNIQNNLSGSYVLGSNIDASPTSGWNSGAGFAPIGSPSTPFIGTFDGAGFTVSNLYINRPTTSTVGLFGSVGSTGSVQNVGITSANIRGNLDTGALVGWNAGTVTGSFSTGLISGTNVGGLVGENAGTITKSFSNATATSSPFGNAGGLVGATWSTSFGNSLPGSTHTAVIKDSYATGNSNSPVAVGVTGGLVGGIYTGGNFFRK